MMPIRTMDTCSPVGSVSGAKGIVDVNVSQFGQRRPEGVDLLRGGLSLKQRIRTQMQPVTTGGYFHYYLTKTSVF